MRLKSEFLYEDSRAGIIWWKLERPWDKAFFFSRIIFWWGPIDACLCWYCAVHKFQVSRKSLGLSLTDDSSYWTCLLEERKRQLRNKRSIYSIPPSKLHMRCLSCGGNGNFIEILKNLTHFQRHQKISKMSILVSWKLERHFEK